MCTNIARAIDEVCIGMIFEKKNQPESVFLQLCRLRNYLKLLMEIQIYKRKEEGGWTGFGLAAQFRRHLDAGATSNNIKMKCFVNNK